jgi:hypothetical protein
MRGTDSERAAPQESSIANNAALDNSFILACMRKFVAPGFQSRNTILRTPNLEKLATMLESKDGLFAKKCKAPRFYVPQVVHTAAT